MPDDFRYEPQSCNIGNGIGQMTKDPGASCGAKSVSASAGLNLWKQWYDKAKVPVPHFTAGTDVAFNITLTIDHGGQAWMMFACAENISETNNWVLLPRSMKDRDKHFMPSAPGAIAWAPLEFHATKNDQFTTWHHIPEDFACPSGHGVARWLWKTGNSCNDANNIARKTEKFNVTEFGLIVRAYQPGSWIQKDCTSPPETFISCMDFLIGEGPAPGPPTPGPAPGPTPGPSPGPTPAPCDNAIYKQCGGNGWSGSTCCAGKCTCQGTASYKQCKPPANQWKC